VVGNVDRISFYLRDNMDEGRSSSDYMISGSLREAERRAAPPVGAYPSQQYEPVDIGVAGKYNNWFRENVQRPISQNTPRGMWEFMEENPTLNQAIGTGIKNIGKKVGGLIKGASASPPLANQILAHVQDRLGVDTKKLNDFAMVVSGVESDYGTNIFNPVSSAKGIYQFTDESFVTAKNRLKNILGYLPENIKNVESIDKLSAEDQKALFFAHLTEDKGSDKRMIKYLKGESSGRELFEKNHYKGVVDDKTSVRLDRFF
jgi:hypothetical protein|tara:strand:+ start:1157 stop:1936 length:780 start_codon:yes stop_codon:yes gene_type:complete